MNGNKTLGIGQILELTAQKKTTAEKVQFLRDNFSGTLADILIFAYHPQVKFLLPDGVPPYTPNDVANQEHMLFREVRKIPNLIDHPDNKLTQFQREKIYIDILQNVSPRDALLLIAIKDREAPYGIDESIIREAFPDLLPPKE